MSYYLPKGYLIFEKEEGKFENIPGKTLKEINAYTLHNKYSIMKFKEAISLIVKTLNIIVIPRDVSFL